ncbi:MAG TPA: hypothetical protein PLO61_03365 [Fimbriimonadaceae bacterium]|nr:hypothetical protein [Fimbriimonadaceae bacterium]HRJ32670.1 hypothetical protein [Fimbriimonadaceae bacterium]
MRIWTSFLLVFALSSSGAQLNIRDSSKPLADPKFASATARAQFRKVLAVFERPKSIFLQLEGGGARRSIWVRGRQARFHRADVIWAHDGKTLTARFPRQNIFISGVCSRTDLYETLGNQDHSVDPFLRNLWRSMNPIRQFLGPEMTMTATGSIQLSGVGDCFILTGKSATRRLSIVARKSNGVPVTLTADSLDRQGKVLSTSTVTFLKVQRNLSMPPETFRVKPQGNERRIGISKAPD